MKTFKKLAFLFRGLSALFAMLLTLAVVGYGVAEANQSFVDGFFGIDSRYVDDQASADIYADTLSTYQDADLTIEADFSEPVVEPCFEIKPPIIENTGHYLDKVGWEYAWEGINIALAVLTALICATWIVSEVIPVKKEEN